MKQKQNEKEAKPSCEKGLSEILGQSVKKQRKT
jgi:hypothetical protein